MNREGIALMKPNLALRTANSDLLPTQDRYAELLSAGDVGATTTAWRGDTALYLLVVLSGETAVSGLHVAGGAFRSPAGEIAAGAVSCVFLKETKAFVGNGKKDDGSRQSFPDVLYGPGPVNLEPARVQGVFVSVHVPEGAAPGIYQGEIQVTAGGLEAPLTKQLTLEVLDVVQPAPEDYRFDIELWQYPYRVAQYYGLEPFSQEHLEVLRPHLERYRALGGHAITASVVEEPWNGQTYGAYPSMVKWIRRVDRSFTFDFSDFDRWVGFCRELGLGDKIICYSLIPWGHKVAYYDEKKKRMKSAAPRPGTRRYRKLWAPFLQALCAHAQEKGWYDQIYIGIDERKRMEKAYNLIDSVTASFGAPLKKAAAMDHFSAGYFPLIDRMASVSVGSDPAKKALEDYRVLAKRRKEAGGLQTTVYTCVGHFPNSFTYSLPAESYWTIFFAAAQGANGFLRWAYDAWVKDPLRDTTHVSFESGDCFLVYPDEPDSAHPQTKSSVRLEKLAQGMRDINKLLFLAEQSPALAQQARLLLSQVRMDYTQQGEAVADEKTRAQLPADMEALRQGLWAMTRAFLSGRA